MYVGLNLSSKQAPLTDSEDEKLQAFWGYLLMSPTEYNAMSDEDKELYAELSRTFHIGKITQTRTISRKQ